MIHRTFIKRSPFGALEIQLAPFGRSLIACSLKPGFGWFRVFGWGLTWKDSSRHELLFSERNGLTRRLRIGTWGFGLVRGGR